MPRSWIFQVNPNRFDIDGFLAIRPGPTRWLVTRYAKEIKRGDTVYICRSASGGDPALSGIIAKAIVLSEPQIGSDDPKAFPFWKASDDRERVALRAGIRIMGATSPKGVLKRTDLVADRALRALPILKMPNSTNYRLEPPLAGLLDELWN